ncbi:MAG: M15 family metallopeptidase [Pseudomonadota bacterium]
MIKNRSIIIICLLASLLVLFLAFSISRKSQKLMDNFSKSPIDHKLRNEMIKKKIWNITCPITLDRLTLLRVSYIDFDGNNHDDGELVVFDVIADHVLAIFKELYDNKFPIESINLINKYNGNDELSMEQNNSSSFNCRNIPNSSIISLHSYGMAIDVNPQQNPYLITSYENKKTSVPIFPPIGMEYINRTNIRAGMVETVFENKETVIDVFKKHGFSIWGGNWNDPIDWHHFQVTREQAETMVKLPYEEAVEYFNNLVSTNN